MLLRDRLLARIVRDGQPPDYVRLASDVLGIRNAPPDLARRLVEQALVVEDRREAWLRAGERICAAAPAAPGVYVLRDAEGRAVYVGKANDMRRRLRTHFAARRWRHLGPDFVRAEWAECVEAGSEVEALLLEAAWIRDLAPPANVQVGPPDLQTRAVPRTLVRDTILVLPSAAEASVELVAVRVDGGVAQVRVRRDGRGLAARVTVLRAFVAQGTGVTAVARRAQQEAGKAPASGAPDRVFDGLAPVVFSWLAGRGQAATRVDPHESGSARELERRLKVLLADEGLFSERIVVVRSRFRSTPARP